MKTMLFITTIMILLNSVKGLSSTGKVCSNIMDCYQAYTVQSKMTQDNGSAFDENSINKCLAHKSAIKDLNNGFIKFNCELLTHGVEAAIFSGASNSKYLFITDVGVSVCNSKIMKISKKNLVEVTSKLIPNFPKKFLLEKYQQRFTFKKFNLKKFGTAHSEVCLRLPRYGTIVNAVSHWDDRKFYDKAIFQLSWNKSMEKFTIQSL